MAKLACKYPNLAAEMTRSQLDFGTLYEEVSKETNRTIDTVSNWFTGRAGELPTATAFSIKEKYFPDLSVDYLFARKPIAPIPNDRGI